MYIENVTLLDVELCHIRGESKHPIHHLFYALPFLLPQYNEVPEYGSLFMQKDVDVGVV
jgi:hypothetical protein